MVWESTSLVPLFWKVPIPWPVFCYITTIGPTLLVTWSLSVSQCDCQQVCVCHTPLNTWNATPVTRRQRKGRSSAAARALLLEDIWANADFPFLKGSQAEVLYFPRRMRNPLFIMGWWERKKRGIETERETNNGKINRELNLTPQETVFEPKQLGTHGDQCGRLFHCTVSQKRCDRLSNFFILFYFFLNSMAVTARL